MNRRNPGPGSLLYSSHAMLELVRALGLGTAVGPATQGRELVQIVARCEFEGFGRASESWDIVWMLTLSLVRHYWRATDGWRVGSDPTEPMTFKGRDDAECIAAALQFLRDVSKPERILYARPAALAADALDDEIADADNKSHSEAS